MVTWPIKSRDLQRCCEAVRSTLDSLASCYCYCYFNVLYLGLFLYDCVLSILHLKSKLNWTEPVVTHIRGGPRLANRPVFPGTSRISASVSRVPAWVFPGRKMSRIWPLHSFCFEYVYSYWIPVQSKSVWQQQLVASRSYDEFWGTRNVFRIVSAALSVPDFLSDEAKWTAERNRVSVALIRSELQIYVNFGMTCSEFYRYMYVLSDSKLLNAAASGQKYY